MTQVAWIAFALILAVFLDLYFVRNWRRYRNIRQDEWSRRERIRAWFGLPIKPSQDADEVGKLANIRTKLRDFWALKTTKIIVFIISIGLVLAGQYLMGQSEPIESLVLTSQRINDQYRIDVDNLDNVLAGAPLILLGGILFAISAREIIFRGDEFETGLKDTKSASTPNSKLTTYLIVGGGSLAFLITGLFFFQPNLIDTILWIISIATFLIAAFWIDQAAGISLKIKLAPSEVVQLILFISFGLIVGVYQLQDVPNLLMGDEGTFFETARAIALGEYTPSPFDLGVYSYPILSSFWQAGILKFFGITLWGWRFASVLPAVLTVIPLYLLARDLFGRAVGVVSALALLISPYFLAFARMGYNNSQSIFIVTLCVWLIYFGSKRGSVFYALLGGAAAGFGFLTYTAGRLGLVVAGLYFLILLIAKSSKGKRRGYIGHVFFPFLVGWAVIALPSLIYTQQQVPDVARNKMLEGLFFQANYGLDFYEADELFQDSPALELDSHTFFYNPQVYKNLLVRGIARTLLAFHHDELVSEHFISGNLAGPLATIFYTLGIFLVLGRLRDRRFLLIGMWFFSGLFFLSFINTYPPRHQHLVPVIPAVAIITGLGVVAFIQQIITLFVAESKKKRAFQFALANVIVLALGVTGLRAYFVVMPTVYRPHLEQVMNWFGLYNSPDVDFVLIHTEPVHEAWRPYLFRELLADHKFSSIDAEEFLSDKGALGVHSNVAIFYNPEDAKQLTTNLQRIYPDAQKLTFYSKEQKPVAEAILQGDVNVPARVGFFEGLLDALTSPVMWLLIPLFLFVTFYGINHKHDLKILPLLKDSVSDRFPVDETGSEIPGELSEGEKQLPSEISKDAGFFEMGFFIRFSAGNSFRRFEPKFSIRFKEKDNSDTQEDEV